jgi:hypothetical protein
MVVLRLVFDKPNLALHVPHLQKSAGNIVSLGLYSKSRTPLTVVSLCQTQSLVSYLRAELVRRGPKSLY